jgi:RNA polymerase sigma-70 factor, ECF subfamily
MPLSDTEIIEKILNGSPDHFRLLVEKYRKPVAGVIVGMLGSCPEAEDVGQETFIRLYNSLPGFRGESALKTYIIRIAMNLSLNELKRRKRLRGKTVYLDSGVTINQDNGLSLHERNEITEMINIAAEKLDPRQKSVFTLRILEGYSTRETAKILRIPEGTVLSRMSRALAEMRELVKEK